MDKWFVKVTPSFLIEVTLRQRVAGLRPVSSVLKNDLNRLGSVQLQIICDGPLCNII